MKRMMFLVGSCLMALAGFAQQAPDMNTKMAITSVAAADMTRPDVQINPNPVAGETFTLELLNLPKGRYNIYLFNKEGRKYLVKALNAEGSSTEELQLPKNTSKGVYILQVISKNDAGRIVKKMIVE